LTAPGVPELIVTPLSAYSPQQCGARRRRMRSAPKRTGFQLGRFTRSVAGRTVTVDGRVTEVTSV